MATTSLTETTPIISDIGTRKFGTLRYPVGSQKAVGDPSELPFYSNLGFKADMIPTIREKLPTPGGYKWLDAYLDSLDPEVDYEQIIRTEFNYRFSNFFFTIPYTLAFINVQQNPLGADLVPTTGKAFGQNFGHARQTDGNGFFFTWMLEGINSEVTQNSFRRLNTLHQSIAKRVPDEVFSDKDDYISALIEISVFGQVLRHTLGLPPMSEHRKTAQLNWSRAVYANIWTGEEMGDLSDFSDTFEGMMKYRRDRNDRPHPKTKNMALVGVTLINHFCYRLLPRPLWFLGRQLIILFLPDSSVRLFSLGPRKPVLEWIIRFVFSNFLRLGAILPDPKTGLIDLIEESELKKATGRSKKTKKSQTTSTITLGLAAIVCLFAIWVALASVKGSLN